MTLSAERPREVGQRVKLSGSVRNLQRKRDTASFVLTTSDQATMGAVALAAGVAGLGSLAISTASAAANAEEEADYVEFNLGEEHVVGWIWRSPFKECDQVDVAAIWDGERYQLQLVSRQSDGVVGLYPHCSRGAHAHIRNAAKWWLIQGLVLTVFTTLLGALAAGAKVWQLLPDAVTTGIALSFGFFGLMIIALTRKWMPFVHVAESAFRTMGWPNPERIDLVKSSKRLRKGDEPAEYGVFYFRYKPD